MLPVGFSANLQCYADSPTAKRIQKSKSLVSECVLIIIPEVYSTRSAEAESFCRSA